MNRNAAQWENAYHQWLHYPDLDQELAEQLRTLSAAEQEDSFHRDLEFGTGGLRGVIGVGTNRMNIYTVARATQGLADYLRQTDTYPSCAIAYDSRNKSDLFAKVAAGVLVQSGIKVFLYAELMPTPMLSFAVRHLGCSAGVVVTASHNPAKYNGYKVYGSDGCQITLEAAEQILACIGNVAYFTAPVEYAPQFDAGKITMIGQETLDAYYEAVLAHSIQKPAVPLQVVYSPLNGAGLGPVTHILQAIGNVETTVVPAQEKPDGNFPTCPYPNPEIEEAMQLAADLAAETGADFCLATDPDCDRVGAGVVTPAGITLVSGNEMGVLLFDFICRKRMEQGRMPKHPVAIKTIVTTEMAAAVAQKYGVELRNVLTGFKFIGEQIGLLDAQGDAGRYIFGFEESYGYLSGAFVRDKDAVNASMLICEMAAYYKAQGKNLLEAMQALYNEYGYYQSELLTYTFEGSTGMTQMCAILDGVRADRPSVFAGKAVQQMTDYQHDDTGLPKSNVISLALADGWHLVLRPSGTEPKLKLYLSVRADNYQAAGAAIGDFVKACDAFVESAK